MSRARQIWCRVCAITASLGVLCALLLPWDHIGLEGQEKTRFLISGLPWQPWMVFTLFIASALVAQFLQARAGLVSAMSFFSGVTIATLDFLIMNAPKGATAELDLTHSLAPYATLGLGIFLSWAAIEIFRYLPEPDSEARDWTPSGQ